MAGQSKKYSGEVPENTKWAIPPLRLNDGPQGFRVRNHTAVLDGGTSTQWPSNLAISSSWDTALVREWGAAVGAEFAAKGANVMLGPGMCIHRVPNDGR